MYINYFWHGAPLGDIEIVSMLSSLAVGERVRLFSYEKLKNIPDGVELADAREVMDQDQLIRFRATQSPALGSNRFRYNLQKKQLGIWFDLDILQLKKIDPSDNFIFGFEDQSIINSAVLRTPFDSELLDDLLAFTSQQYPNPPFYDQNTKSLLIDQANKGNPVPVEALPWGVFGPQALTYFIKKNNLLDQVKPRECFYPIHHSQAHLPFMANIDISQFIKEQTTLIHLWNEMLRKPSYLRPHNLPGQLLIEKGSYFETFAQRTLGYKLYNV